MKLALTGRARKALLETTPQIRKAFYKQVELLCENMRHPSLHAKKYDETTGVWQARVNRDWRFYFIVQGGTYIILNITSHPK